MNQAIDYMKKLSASYSTLKPQSKSYKRLIVTDKDGNVVNPLEWAKLTEGRRITSVLRHTGYNTRMEFDKEAFEKAKQAFYMVKHAHDRMFVESLITDAFEEAKVPKSKKTDRILRSMIPMLKKLPAEQIEKKLIEVLKTIEGPVTNDRRESDLVKQ